MAKPRQEKKVAGMSDAAVAAKTGKTWAQWLAVLDKAGARRMSHREIARHLGRTTRLSGWWQQMVTVGYEQARGRREKHQKPDGYEISASRTLAASAATVFRAWRDDRARRRWLVNGKLTIRKATPSKSLRICWADGKTSLSVNFYRKGSGCSQVVVQHGKLADAQAAARMKAYWGRALGRLEAALAR